MALLFMDGFDYVISGEDWTTKWEYTNSVTKDTVMEGRRGGYCLKLDYYTSTWAKYYNNLNETIIFGSAIKIDTYNQRAGGYYYLVGFSSTPLGESTYPEMKLYFNAGSLTAGHRTGSSSYEVVGIAETGTFKTNTWHYLEVKCRIHSSGTFIVKVDGREILSYSGETNYPTYDESIACFAIKGRNNNAEDYTWWDDMYILTDSGEAPTDFLGDCMVDTIYPSASGEYTEMTPSSGENWECINETIIDDTDYVTGGLEEKENYDYQDVSGESAIHGIQLIDVHKISVGSIIYGNHLLSIYGNDYSGEETALGGWRNINESLFGLDPESGEAWTSDKINKYEFGKKILLS